MQEQFPGKAMEGPNAGNAGAIPGKAMEGPNAGHAGAIPGKAMCPDRHVHSPIPVVCNAEAISGKVAGSA